MSWNYCPEGRAGLNSLPNLATARCGYPELVQIGLGAAYTIDPLFVLKVTA